MNEENLLEDTCGCGDCACGEQAAGCGEEGGCGDECNCGGLPADVLSLLYLDEPAGTLEPAVLAFVLGNDPEYVEALVGLDEQQSQEWAKDPENGLDEARAWALSAEAKRAALQYLQATPRPAAEYEIDEAMERVELAAEAASDVYAACESDEPEDCPDHGAAYRAADEALTAAVEAMRAEVLAAFAAFEREHPRTVTVEG